MDVGALDRRILIEVPTATRDAYGATVPGWTTLTTVWGNVIPIMGTERQQQGTQVATAFFRITIRYRADFDTKARVTIDGTKVALVRSINELGRRDWSELFCEQAV